MYGFTDFAKKESVRETFIRSAGESEGERPEIRHAEKSDGNPCFGVRGSKGTSTEKTGKLRFFMPTDKK